MLSLSQYNLNLIINHDAPKKYLSKNRKLAIYFILFVLEMNPNTSQCFSMMTD